MTDKEQIIIDGVNVGKCEYYRYEDVYSYEEEKFISGCCEGEAVLNDYGELMCYRPCKGQDCYFKQLAREKQECEYWRHQAELGSETTDILSKQVEEEIKKCDELKSESFTREELITLQEKDIDCYRKALKEIEEVVKGMHSICIEEISITASQLNDRIYRESCERFKQILDIIKKARETQ